MKVRKILILSILASMILIGSATIPLDAVAQEDDEVDEYPYVFQEWCLDHTGCTDFGVRNRTESWLQIYAEELRTGEKDFFTVRSGDNVYITGRPGPYWWHFVWWCNGEIETWTVDQAPLNQNWIILFRCPNGFDGSIYKGGGGGDEIPQ